MNQKRKTEAPQIPAFRFSGFSGEWNIKTLEDFGESSSGVAIESEFVENGKYKVISIGSYSLNSTYTDQNIRANKSEKIKNRILNKNDLTMVLNDKTQSGEIIGRVLLIDKDDTYTFNQRTQRIEVDQKSYNSKFLYQFLNSFSQRSKIIKLSQGNTQIYVNWSAIKNIQYLVPELEEQTQIGEFFQTIDRLIELQSEKVAQAERYKKAMLQKLFPQKGETIPKLRFAGFSGEWELKSLKEITTVITKGSTPQDKSWTGSVNFVKTESINPNTGELSEVANTSLEEHKGYLKRSQLQENDLLFSIVGTLGRVGYVQKKDLPANTNQQIAILRLKKNFPLFIFNSLKTNNVKRFIKSDATIGAQPSLSLWQIESLRLYIPSLKEQTQIGNFFQTLDKQIEAEEQKLERYQTLKRAMLQRMFV